MRARFKVNNGLKKGGKKAEAAEAKTAYHNVKRMGKHAIWLTKYEEK